MKKTHSFARSFIVFSKLFFLFSRFFSICAFVDVLFSIFEKLLNLDNDFEMKMLANDVVSSMWNIINIRAFEFFTLTFSNIIVFEFNFFSKNFLNYSFYLHVLYRLLVNIYHFFILFFFSFSFICCSVVVLNS